MTFQGMSIVEVIAKAMSDQKFGNEVIAEAIKAGTAGPGTPAWETFMSIFAKDANELAALEAAPFGQFEGNGTLFTNRIKTITTQSPGATTGTGTFTCPIGLPGPTADAAPANAKAGSVSSDPPGDKPGGQPPGDGK